MHVIPTQTKPLFQERFLDFLSHDLREPARMVSQFLKLLKDRNENSMDQKSEEFLEYAISASQKMDKMIQALTGMSRLQREQEPKVEVNMIELSEIIHSELNEIIHRRNASLIYKGSTLVHSRKEAVNSIIKELVFNSISHARPEQDLRIEISAVQIDKTVRIQVKDNGKPIPQKWREKVFEPFQKYHQDCKGLGIGLTKSRLLVEKYNGNISMEISDLEETVVICVIN